MFKKTAAMEANRDRMRQFRIRDPGQSPPPRDSWWIGLTPGDFYARVRTETPRWRKQWPTVKDAVVAS